MLPAGRSTFVSSMLPDPLEAKPVAPPVSVAVNVAPTSELVSGSVTVAFALPDPAFVTTIVYVIAVPGTALPGAELGGEAGRLSVTVTWRSVADKAATVSWAEGMLNSEWVPCPLTALSVAPVSK